MEIIGGEFILHLFVDYLTITSDMFYGLTITSTRQLTYMVAKANHIDTPTNWIDSEMFGYDWLKFFKRHRDSLCVIRRQFLLPLLQCSIQLLMFKTILLITILDTRFLNSSKYSLDTSGCTTVQNVPKIVCQKQVAQFQQERESRLHYVASFQLLVWH